MHLYDLSHLNHLFASLSLIERLEWLLDVPNLVQVSSFGPSGMVIIDCLSKITEKQPIVVFIDTLHHFDETLEHANKCKQIYNLDLRIYHCQFASTEIEFVDYFRCNTMYLSDHKRYDDLVKVEPLHRAFNELGAEAWITGRRRDQGGERTDLQFFEFDGDHRLKINPLADWTHDQVWEYLKSRYVPWNPLHDLGYKSIGDKYTTKAVSENDPERAGRFFQNQSKTECGIHIKNEK